MKSGENSQSSQDQGFISYDVEIQGARTYSLMDFYQATSSFEPKYITNSVALRKEHSLVWNTTSVSYEKSQKSLSQVIANQTQKSTKKSIYRSAYQHYYLNMQFRLVYSRFKQPFGNANRTAFQHQIRVQIGKPDLSQGLKEWRKPDKSFGFDSKFECGNLLCAFEDTSQPNSYVLFMQNDTNTYGYSQWFYFAINNPQPNITYTFKIVNFKKPYSFFGKGQQPMVFSLKKAEREESGWYCDGDNISYYRFDFQEADSKPYYTLQFKLTFAYEKDYIMICPYLPYSYSRLMHNIQKIQSIAQEKDIDFRIACISRSLAGNKVPYITMTAKNDKIGKPNIVILARQHAAQNWSSFLVEQLMNRLSQAQDMQTQQLLNSYNFHIFPMVNVDGVIYGNFRCDLAGQDINRRWKHTNPSIHPQVIQIKQKIHQLKQQGKVQLCLDLHTHSKALGVFGYCCVQSEQCRILPFIFSQLCPLFRYPSCTFGIAADKKMTARAIIHNLTKNINTITVQISSFGHYDRKSQKYRQFRCQDMNELAKAILVGYHQYSQKPQNHQNIQEMMKKAINQQEDEFVFDCSDSDPEVDQIQHSLRIKKIFPQKIAKQLQKSIKKRMKHASVSSSKRSDNPKGLDRSDAGSPEIQYQINVETRQKSRTVQQHPNIVVSLKVNRKMNSSLMNSTIKPRSRLSQKVSVEKTANSYKFKTQSNNHPALSKIEFSLKNLPIFRSSSRKGANCMPFLQSVNRLTFINKERRRQIARNKAQINYQHPSRLTIQPQSRDQTIPTSTQKVVQQHKQKQQINQAHKTMDFAQKIDIKVGLNKVQIQAKKINEINMKQQYQEKIVACQKGYPFLCVASQNKKQQFMVRMKERRAVHQRTGSSKANNLSDNSKEKELYRKLFTNRKQPNNAFCRVWMDSSMNINSSIINMGMKQ